jgi:hypothetical protein
MCLYNTSHYFTFMDLLSLHQKALIYYWITFTYLVPFITFVYLSLNQCVFKYMCKNNFFRGKFAYEPP